MHPDPCAGFFVTLLLLFLGLKFLFGMLGLSGVFHGFWPGFWAGFFDRLFVGSRRRGTPGPFGCLALAILALFSMGWVAAIFLMLLNSLPASPGN